jgi:hypothetical protein
MRDIDDPSLIREVVEIKGIKYMIVEPSGATAMEAQADSQEVAIHAMHHTTRRMTYVPDGAGWRGLERSEWNKMPFRDLRLLIRVAESMNATSPEQAQQVAVKALLANPIKDTPDSVTQWLKSLRFGETPLTSKVEQPTEA